MRSLRSLRKDGKGQLHTAAWIGGALGVLVVILVGVSLLTPVQDTIDNSSATGSAATLLDLVPLLFVVGIVLFVVAFALYAVSKSSGGGM
jgi:uncharacterized membrane protein YtjA (UPF0391 family)